MQTSSPKSKDGALVHLSAEVSDALAEGRPVVALESTIIAHGLPYPDNLTTAQLLERTIREAGAVPATIAVLDGVFRVGLAETELARIAGGPDLPKLSRRDLGAVIARRGSGATTVAATMIGARLAGIGIFATGGIGGVHRGAAESFDISADLDELARTPVVVVCAGAKAILDLPKTLEYLETKGIPVIGYETEELPAFYSRQSGIAVPIRADGPADVAAIIRAQRGLGLAGGAVIAVPVPEAAALPGPEMDRVIDRALVEAGDAGVVGKAVTPFLLRRIAELTDGRALRANIALAENNARVAAGIAVALAEADSAPQPAGSGM